MANPTPSVSGTFINRPENGQEWGADVGAQGLLGTPIYSPFAGTVNIDTSSTASKGWSPGRVLINVAPSEGGGVFGVGHINPTVKTGDVVSIGQQIGTVGDSSRFGGTPQSNAHIETMYSQSGTSMADFTSGGSNKANLDIALGMAAYQGTGGVGSLGGAQNNSSSGTDVNSTPSGSTTSPSSTSSSLFDPSTWGNALKTPALYVGFFLLGLVIIGAGLLSTSAGKTAAKTGAKAAIA